MLSQQIVSGLAAGCLYAFAALGIVLIYKTSGIVNFAQGDLATFSTFVAFVALTALGLPLPAAFLLALAFAALLGALLAVVVLRPIAARGALIPTIATLGISMVLYGVAGWLWGYDTKAFPATASGPPLTVAGVVISLPNLSLFATTALLVLGLYLFFKHTLLGLALRAVAENRLAAQLAGIGVSGVFVASWVASAVLGALAGLLSAPITFLDPGMMADVVVKAFAAAVLGGLTSLPGAVVGGLILGVLENLVGGYLATELRTTFAFLVIVLVLIVRPSGLLGEGSTNVAGGIRGLVLVGNRTLYAVAMRAADVIRRKGYRPVGNSGALPVPPCSDLAGGQEHAIDSPSGGPVSWRAAIVLLALLCAALAPLAGSYFVYVLSLAGIYAIVAVGLNLLTGCTGQVSIGHAGFLAIGGYTSALLTLRLGLPLWLALPIAGLIAGLIGWGLGLPALRLSGPYLAIATLGFGVAVPQLALNWDAIATGLLRQPALVGLTGGAMGLKTGRPGLGGLSSDLAYYYIVLLALVLLSLAAANLLRSRIGRAFLAMRDSPLGAQAAGISLARHKTQAFAVSACYAGIAGGLLAHLVQFISPESFNLLLSIELLTMIVLGGLASIPGAIAGALFLTALSFLASGVKNLPMVVYGIVLVVCLAFLPDGLAGFGTRLAAWARRGLGRD